MKLELSREFEKQYKKLTQKQSEKVAQTLQAFLRDKSIVSLRYHALRGEWQGHYSISAGGDLRIHIRYISETVVLIVAVGSHSQLYR
jgi:addiction module RelE/StbE family toxin